MTTTQSPVANEPQPSQRRQLLSFIAPVPDENASPEDLYAAVRKQTEALEADWEVIFINQGECEKTWLQTQLLLRKFPDQVRVLQLCGDQSRAAALAMGYREAKGDLVFTLESDQQDDPAELGRFLRLIEWGGGNQRSEDSGTDQRWQNILPPRRFACCLSARILCSHAAQAPNPRRREQESLPPIRRLIDTLPIAPHLCSVAAMNLTTTNSGGPRRSGVSPVLIAHGISPDAPSN